MPTSTPPTHFGLLLREWRRARRLTQEGLAERADVSTRHLSFLETGRAQASREMTLALGDALDLPLRERNTLLAAAGFAPVYRETPLGSAPMAHLRRAIDRILAQQEPFPAMVIDRMWNLLRLNRGGEHLLGRLFAGRTPPPEVQGNLLHALFHPEGLRQSIVGWETLAGLMAARLHRDAAADPSQDGLRQLRDQVLAYPGVPAGLRSPPLGGPPPIAVVVHVRAADGGEARLFTMLTTLGTPLDVTAEELRIELYFPVDAASEGFFQDP